MVCLAAVEICDDGLQLVVVLSNGECIELMDGKLLAAPARSGQSLGPIVLKALQRQLPLYGQGRRDIPTGGQLLLDAVPTRITLAGKGVLQIEIAEELLADMDVASCEIPPSDIQNHAHTGPEDCLQGGGLPPAGIKIVFECGY